MREKKKNANYIDNKRFMLELQHYRAAYMMATEKNKQKPRQSEYLGACFQKIAENFSRHVKFRNYPFREEMVADAVLCCVKYAHNFDSEKSPNPFGYFTKVCLMAFIQRIKREKKYLYTKFKAIIDTELFADISATQDGIDHDIQLLISEESRTKMAEFVENFEKTELKK